MALFLSVCLFVCLSQLATTVRDLSRSLGLFGLKFSVKKRNTKIAQS